MQQQKEAQSNELQIDNESNFIESRTNSNEFKNIENEENTINDQGSDSSSETQLSVEDKKQTNSSSSSSESENSAGQPGDSNSKKEDASQAKQIVIACEICKQKENGCIKSHIPANQTMSVCQQCAFDNLNDDYD